MSGSRVLPVALAALLAASCGSGDDAASTPTGPVSGLVASLEDDVRTLPDDRIAWSTDWVLCWAPYPGARAYEVQTLTAEGVSPSLRRQRHRCLRLEAAAGENTRSEGLLNRDVQLALASSQLAFRIRAVLKDGRASVWSPPAAVGKTTAP